MKAREDDCIADDLLQGAEEMTAAGANARFYLALSLLGGVYVVLILAMLAADLSFTSPGHLWEARRAYCPANRGEPGARRSHFRIGRVKSCHRSDSPDGAEGESLHPRRRIDRPSAAHRKAESWHAAGHDVNSLRSFGYRHGNPPGSFQDSGHARTCASIQISQRRA